ncbi:MAG: tRNA 2-thiouridine(34) synthase MnmA [Fimbriimonadaceae bacterium]
MLVAMSGGVDSSVAAALLVRRGYDVVGVTMQIWQESQTDPRHAGCCSLGAVEDARRVARLLGIPHYVINFREEFRESVISDFIESYAAGRTPNPCVQCNKKVKFESLLEKMREFGCDRLVTGHYARIRRGADGRYRLMQARGSGKDQSYVLYMLRQDQLAVSWFPLGEMPSKAATRDLAAALGLPVASKPDSQEICFVSEAGGYREFLRRHRPDVFAKGEIVDAEGRVLGQHGGVAEFTVGQRRGIGLTPRDGRPLYVLSLDPSQNRVVVGRDRDLLRREVPLQDVHWGAVEETPGPVAVRAKIRYNMDPMPAQLFGGDRPRLVFREAVRAVTPGQIAVAYRGKTVVAGGVIAAQA